MTGDAGNNGKPESASDQRDDKKGCEAKTSNASAYGNDFVGQRGKGADENKQDAPFQKPVLYGGEFFRGCHCMRQIDKQLFDAHAKPDTDCPSKAAANDRCTRAGSHQLDPVFWPGQNGGDQQRINGNGDDDRFKNGEKQHQTHRQSRAGGAQYAVILSFAKPPESCHYNQNFLKFGWYG